MYTNNKTIKQSYYLATLSQKNLEICIHPYNAHLQLTYYSKDNYVKINLYNKQAILAYGITLTKTQELTVIETLLGGTYLLRITEAHKLPLDVTITPRAPGSLKTLSVKTET